MQLRFETSLSDEAYVLAQGWRMARLPSCPLHPQGGCSFSRHGTYCRVTPAGTRIPRWYCPEGHCTFSLLPDFLASRLPGTLVALERVVLHAEHASSVEAAANTLRPDDVSLPSAARWVRRRTYLVRDALVGALQAAPVVFRDGQPSLASFQRRLQATGVLLALRTTLAVYLPRLPAPLGFAPRGKHVLRIQHNSGADPPTACQYCCRRSIQATAGDERCAASRWYPISRPN